MTKNRYDYIIAGGGCAGLSLAYYLSQSTLAGCSVLIVDRDEKVSNDRTWCFWTDRPTPFEPIVYRRWGRLAFADAEGRLSQDLGDRSYQLIRGADFYRFVKEHLRHFPNIQWLQGSISDMNEEEGGAGVVVDGRRYHGRYVFNSFQRPPAPEPGRYHHLLQHFSGWVIESPRAVFDPGEALLMDFRTPQRNSARFFYVLPFSEREALVEYTIFSTRLLPREAYARRLHQYVQQQIGLNDYCIREREHGVIPMTDAPFPIRRSDHIINIGTVGGAVKPTTGYAFLNIQEQTRTIVERLECGACPAVSRSYPRRFRFYDTLLLHILEREGQEAARIFSALFRHNPLHRILTFLKEDSHLLQEAAIFSRLPFKPFLLALFNTQLGAAALPPRRPAIDIPAKRLK